MSAQLPIFFALLAMGMARAGLSEDASMPPFAPENHPIERYEHIWKRSPFIVETVTAVQSPGLATKYALVGLAASDSDPMVFLVDRNEADPAKNRILVSLKHPNHNIELVSISLDSDPRKSSAMIRQGGEQATLPFDVSVLPPTAAGGQSEAPAPISQIPKYPIPRADLMPNLPNNVLNNPNRHPGLISPANAAGGQAPPTPTRRIIRPKPINVN